MQGPCAPCLLLVPKCYGFHGFCLGCFTLSLALPCINSSVPVDLNTFMMTTSNLYFPVLHWVSNLSSIAYFHLDVSQTFTIDISKTELLILFINPFFPISDEQSPLLQQNQTWSQLCHLCISQSCQFSFQMYLKIHAFFLSLMLLPP